MQYVHHTRPAVLWPTRRPHVGHREDRQHRRKQDDQNDARPEHRRRIAHHRQQRDALRQRSVGLPGGQRAQQDRQRNRPDHAGQHQFDRGPDGPDAPGATCSRSAAPAAAGPGPAPGAPVPARRRWRSDRR
ncbi:hypothetical protein G6F24_017319 [Rhizopus arrhizus]|nr:hypothetical protein G6F24_017319 [Rhizopus arrhizus]